MKNNFIITIPSYKRHKYLLYKKNTLSYFNDYLLGKTFLVIREEDIISYGLVCEEYRGTNIFVIPNTVNGISETRDIILNNTIFEYKNNKLEYLFMIDDDIAFAYRPNMDSKILNQTKEQFKEMIELMLYKCSKEYPVVGITARQFSQNKKEFYTENTRIIQVYCFHIPTILKADVYFSDAKIPFMTDYYFILKMLSKGYKNLCLNQYTRDDKMQAPGGCSLTRTVENCNNSAKKLYKHFPNIVSLYWKEGGTWETKQRKLGVRIAWKKAFNKKLYKEMVE